MNKVSESQIERTYNELLHRIQHIGIALRNQRKRIGAIHTSGIYDLTRTDTPSIGEAEDAFKNWNCAILTAFRGSKDLPPEENFKRNEKRNEELKTKLLEQKLKFRSVNGCYREANWEKPNVEICFFVTNIEEEGNQLSAEDNIYSFFNKIYRLAEYYEQDCFLFTFPGVNRVAFLVATNDDGRNNFRSEIKFAGPLFTHVPDIGDWTDCSDGRISFRLKGMILMGGTGNRKIKIGEGDLFDINSYNSYKPDGLVVIRGNKQNDLKDNSYKPDGLVVIRGNEQNDLKDACRDYKGEVPLVERYFMKENQTEAEVHEKIIRALKVLKDKKCKRIGFHCSASIDGSYLKGAKVAYETIQQWAKRNDKKIELIVINDIYGDYSKIMNE